MHALPGWAIILPEEKKMEGSLYLPDSAQEELQRGEIIEINPVVIKETLEYTYPLNVGMKVVFRKYYTNDLELAGKKYKIVKCEDIMVILD